MEWGFQVVFRPSNVRWGVQTWVEISLAGGQNRTCWACFKVRDIHHKAATQQCWAWALKKVTLLGSNLASVTDLKGIETPHSLCCDLGGYKTFTTRWSGGRVQVWVQVWAPPCHLATSPKAVPEGYQRFLGQNQLPSSWGRSPALLARVGRASTNTGVSKSASVTAGSDQLAWGKYATTLVILTRFKSRQGFDAL